MEVGHNDETDDDEDEAGELEFAVGKDTIGEIVGDFLMIDDNEGPGDE